MDIAIKQKFASSIRWTMMGSISYELLKLGHQYLLFKHMPVELYGLIGTIFSLTFLAIHCAYLTPEHSLTPYLLTITQSKNNFRTILPWQFIVQIPLLLLGAGAAFLYARRTLPHHAQDYLWIIAALIVIEGVRMFLRTLLHMIFVHKRAIAIELSVTMGYFATIWIAHLLLQWPLTIKLIFLPYLIGSAIAVVIFVRLLGVFYRAIPEQQESSVEQHHLFGHMLKTSCYNYAMSLTKNLLSGNFLVTIFARRFGLAQAGLFKFASYIADAMRGIIHATLGFSGSALLAALKQNALRDKTDAFRVINEKITKIIYIILIVMIINYQHLGIGKSAGSLLELALLPSALFLLLTFLGHWGEIYIKFYTLQEQARTVFFYQLLEALLFALALGVGLTISPTVTLIGLAISKVICFFLLSADAYSKWRITPSLFAGWRIIALSTVAALLVLQCITTISRHSYLLSPILHWRN